MIGEDPERNEPGMFVNEFFRNLYQDPVPGLFTRASDLTVFAFRHFVCQ